MLEKFITSSRMEPCTDHAVQWKHRLLSTSGAQSWRLRETFLRYLQSIGIPLGMITKNSLVFAILI